MHLLVDIDVPDLAPPGRANPYANPAVVKLYIALKIRRVEFPRCPCPSLTWKPA